MIDALAKAGKSPGDNLWEANWDDDDIEDDFTKQLRWVSDLLVNHVFSIEAACDGTRLNGVRDLTDALNRTAINERNGTADDAMKE